MTFSPASHPSAAMCRNGAVQVESVITLGSVVLKDLYHRCCSLHRRASLLQVPEVHVTAKALLPSTSVIAFTLGNGLSFTTFVNTVPVNANKTINRFALVRKLGDNKLINGIFNAKIWDATARQAMIKCVPSQTEHSPLEFDGELRMSQRY